MQKHSKQSNVSMKSFLFISMLIVGIIMFSSVRANATTVSFELPSYASLTPHDPISITSDNNFTDYGFLGLGTAEDPHIIEGYNITTTDDNGIYIDSTTKHFIVRNCYIDALYYGIYIDDVADGTATVIKNSCWDNNLYGIYLYYSSSSTVANNTCSNSDYYGIVLYFSSNSTVTNNTCSNNNENGIYLRYSGNSTVANNTCNNNKDNGILLWESESSMVANNTCSNNNKGIELRESGGSTVTNNTCNNNYYEGILLEDSNNSIVSNNTFTNCGLCIYEDTVDHYLSYTVENNWVNGKKLGFYTNLDSTVIAEPVYGQLILANCTNVTVRDQIFNNATLGLFLYSCTHSTITNNTCNTNIYDGIYLYSSDNSTVSNNTCQYNGNYGIFLEDSYYSTVFSNSCSNNSLSIKLHSSGNSTVIYNTCSNNNYHGIYLESSDNYTVANNTCSNNNIYGIYLESSSGSTIANNTCSNNSDGGIDLFYSGNSTVIDNTCSNNNYHGISLGHSDNSTLTYNLLHENEGYGVYLSFSNDNNSIHHNTFVDNNLGGTSQAIDDGINNYWYDYVTLEGNFWDDWSGIGPYDIDGDTGAVDPYPLDEPVDICPPLIVNIVHSPSTPTELDTVSINATVTDDSGIYNVTLHYRVNGGTWIETSMTLISVDIYSVTIGPFAVSDTIEYYISAVDNSVNYNEAFNDNSGLYYSFTVSEVIPEFQMFSPLLPTITFLFLGFGLVALQRRKK